MNPASSVSGFYFSHPEAKYFGVGMIARDQVENYAARKGLDIPTVEKWLAPNLSYDPDKIVPTAATARTLVGTAVAARHTHLPLRWGRGGRGRGAEGG